MLLDLNFCFPEAADGTRGPLPKQAQFINNALDKNAPKYTLYCGGIGCMAGDTLVDTASGPKRFTELRLTDPLLGYRAGTLEALGSVPFPKGRDYLYRVRHAHGEFVAAAHHLVACSDGNYRRVDTLRGGDCLLRVPCSEALRQTSSGHDPLASLSDAQRLIERCAGFLEHCLACYRRYGQLPPEVVGIAQECVPLLVGALGYSPSAAHKGDLQALAQGDIRPNRLCSLLSTLDFYRRSEDQAAIEVSPLSALGAERTLRDNPPARLFPLTSGYHRTAAVSSLSRTSFEDTSDVLSVSKSETEDWYWDITVPATGNYLAGGLVHHNSGKTMVGCITMLAWAVLYPGDYLVCRQFAPELKITTLKQFLEITPPELIEEHRVADGIVKIKAVGGKVSNIFFRQLEEPDKLRSLNLSGFYVDESSQVSEAAFMLLQGRLRGPGLRKGILTTNPAGHDWQYMWFVKKDHIKNEAAKAQYSLIKAPSTENVHLPEGYVQSIMDGWSEDRIQREIYGSFDSFSGQVYSDFRRDMHVVKPFALPAEWTRIIGVDHGYRNPSAWVWGAVDYDDNVYIYREFYNREWLIEEICKGKKDVNGRITEPGVMSLMRIPGTQPAQYEKIEMALIDPSVRARRGTTGGSDWDSYVDSLPAGFPLMTANNEKTAGIDRLKSYLKPNARTGKPRLFIFDTCKNLIEEIVQYRYAELPSNLAGRKEENEEPVKVNDHALDALRYLVMSRPEGPTENADVYKKLAYNSLEGALYRDLERLRKPKTPLDPFEDGI